MSESIHRPRLLPTYWQCQLMGWTLAALYWMLAGYHTGRFNVSLAIAYFIPDVVIGIALTHAYHELAHRYGWTEYRLPALLKVALAGVVVMGGLFMALTAIKNYEVRLLFGLRFEPTLGASFKDHWLGLLSTGIRLMAIWILAFHLYHFALHSIKLASEKAQLTLAVKQAQLQRLSAQLNPHFLFNALNSIKALSADDRARRATDLLSTLLRSALDGNLAATVPLKDELSLVNDYLELEKIRFEERLRVNMRVPHSLESMAVPPLFLQTLVENAIKHGIARLPEGGVVSIESVPSPAACKFIVSNPGFLLANGGDRGTGLSNLRERLSLQYGARASVTLRQSDDVVIATVILPTIA